MTKTSIPAVRCDPIKYPQNYTKRNRQVMLTGEAYFEANRAVNAAFSRTRSAPEMAQLRTVWLRAVERARNWEQPG